MPGASSLVPARWPGKQPLATSVSKRVAVPTLPGPPRFAQFFISPLISADGVDREIKAVDSEHGKVRGRHKSLDWNPIGANLLLIDR